VILIGSVNAEVGLEAGYRVLSQAGSALDAVETATRLVEDNPDDPTVGTGGYPNLLGEVELDASIMEGTGRRAGAVAALTGFCHPISVARQVMERLPHVLLAGSGAARFASEIGAETGELLSEEARRSYEEQVIASLGDPRDLQGELAELARMAADPEHVTGTVNILAIDHAGHLASAVSTSGWAWKYPGRVGDSPLIGAGNYCDDRFGAACCTGFGELAVRASTARSVVALLATGTPVAEACAIALGDAMALGGVTRERSVLNVVALDRLGNHAGMSTRAGSSYCIRDESGSGPQRLPRTVLAP
jgi:beta-aspartyl-peptidase (threonine type)